MIKKALLVVLLASPLLVSAKGMRCGPFRLEAANDGFMHINGQKPETQKMTFLKQKDDYDNLKMQWMMPDKQTGRWLGFDYIKRNNKAILNVEGIRMNMDEPRVFGTYDCVKVK